MREWDRLACRALALAPYASPSAALAGLEPGDPSLEELARKNDILRALVGAIQQGGGAAAAASPVLWLALWRGLAQLVRRHAQFLRDPDEAVSEVADRFSTVVHGLRLEHVGRIALTLLRSTQRELQVLRRARAVIRAHELPLFESPALVTGEAEIARLELRLILEKGGDERTVAMLLAALSGMSAEETSRLIGAAPATVQKHTNRALRRLGRRISAEIGKCAVRFSPATPHVEECRADARGRFEMADLKIDRPHHDPRFYDEYLRLPGVFRRWELEQIVDVDCEYRFEDAGLALDGSRLITVYRRELKPHTGAAAQGGGR
jgi:hypothetical protein